MESFFILLLLVAIGIDVYIVTRKGGLDIDGDGDVDKDDAIAVVEEVEEIVEEAVEEFLDFTTMTKAQIEAWAKENLGIDLDRRKTKAKMIAEVESQLKN